MARPHIGPLGHGAAAQLGLVDLGARLVGVTRGEVSVAMAVLALVTLAVAIITGVTSAICTSPGLDEANFVSHHWANVVSLPSWEMMRP